MTMRRLPLWMVLLVLGLCLYGLASISATARPTEPEPKLSVTPHPFLAQQCQACHSGDTPKGKFRLDSLTQHFRDNDNRDRRRAALEQVKSGNMPPKGKPRPTEMDVAAFAEWINGRVAAAETARNAAQGRVPLRRLNRAEYENTVRDLLGVDLDLTELLPPDTSINGFDNGAEALHVSSF